MNQTVACNAPLEAPLQAPLEIQLEIPLETPLEVNERRLEREINYLLSQCQNRGYPFAQVYFDSVTIKKGEVSAKLNLNLNNFIIIDILMENHLACCWYDKLQV